MTDFVYNCWHRVMIKCITLLFYYITVYKFFIEDITTYQTTLLHSLCWLNWLFWILPNHNYSLFISPWYLFLIVHADNSPKVKFVTIIPRYPEIWLLKNYKDIEESSWFHTSPKSFKMMYFWFDCLYII